MADSDNSGVNTILIVLVLVIVVGALAWFLSGGFGAAEPTPDDLNVDVNLPTGGDEDGGDGGGNGDTSGGDGAQY